MSVYRLIGKETIEENMLRAAEKKLQLEAEVVGEESTYASLSGAARTKKGEEMAFFLDSFTLYKLTDL